MPARLPDVSATTLSSWTIGCQPGGMSALLGDHVEQHGHLSTAFASGATSRITVRGLDAASLA
jgi:hypothetical protein